MSLITCPNCGKRISDRALKCPTCGLEREKTIREAYAECTKKFICTECGAEYDIDLDACPNCGCPKDEELLHGQPLQGESQNKQAKEEQPQKVEVTNLKPKFSNKTKKFGIIAAILAVVIILISVIGINISKENAAEEYASTLSLATSAMLDGAIDAEEACTLIHDVWYNCIWEERDTTTDPYTRKNNGSGSFYDDFNDALGVLFLNEDFESDISDIRSSQSLVKDYMKDLQNPPEGYEDAYDAVRDLYDAYTDITNMAVSPTGNLNSYTSDFNDADSTFLNAYNAMELYLD